MRYVAQLFTLLFLCWSISPAQIVGRHRKIFPSGGGASATMQQTPCSVSSGSFSPCVTQACAGASCTITLIKTVAAGDGVVILSGSGNSVSISSVSGIGTVTPCSSGISGSASSGYIQCAYLTSAISTATSVTVNYSGSSGGANVTLFDFSCSGGTISADANYGSGPVSGSPFNGATGAITGSDDVVIQSGISDQNITSVASPYNTNYIDVNGLGMTYLLARSTIAVPSWTAASNTVGYGQAVAMKCQ